MYIKQKGNKLFIKRTDILSNYGALTLCGAYAYDTLLYLEKNHGLDKDVYIVFPKIAILYEKRTGLLCSTDLASMNKKISTVDYKTIFKFFTISKETIKRKRKTRAFLGRVFKEDRKFQKYCSMIPKLIH